jgi:hypothetical protein
MSGEDINHGAKSQSLQSARLSVQSSALGPRIVAHTLSRERGWGDSNPTKEQTCYNPSTCEVNMGLLFQNGQLCMS